MLLHRKDPMKMLEELHKIQISWKIESHWQQGWHIQYGDAIDGSSFDKWFARLDDGIEELYQHAIANKGII